MVFRCFNSSLTVGVQVCSVLLSCWLKRWCRELLAKKYTLILVLWLWTKILFFESKSFETIMFFLVVFCLDRWININRPFDCYCEPLRSYIFLFKELCRAWMRLYKKLNRNAWSQILFTNWNEWVPLLCWIKMTENRQLEQFASICILHLLQIVVWEDAHLSALTFLMAGHSQTRDEGNSKPWCVQEQRWDFVIKVILVRWAR